MIVVLFCDEKNNIDLIEQQLKKFCPVPTMSFCDITEYIRMIKDRSDAVMMIAQKGAQSLETAVFARKNNPKGKLVWFSDINFAILSFRLKATYFGLLPIEDEKIKSALEYCGVQLKNCSESEDLSNIAKHYQEKTAV